MAKARRLKIPNKEELMEFIREKVSKHAWAPFIEAEIIAQEVEERMRRVLDEYLNAPRMVQRTYIQQPITKQLSSLEDILKVEGTGALIELSFTTNTNNYKVYLIRDSEYLLTGETIDELIELSPFIAWLTAVIRADTSEYWFQVSGLDFEKEIRIGVEPTNNTVTLNNFSYSYMKLETP